MADPRRFAPLAEDLVRRARRARQPEALVLALRAHAWAERASLADVTAKRLLDEAARLARRHRLGPALADVLMSRAAVNQELGRMAAAQRDLDAARGLVAPERAVELAFQQAVLHQNIGRLGEAAAIYHELLAGTGTPVRTRVIAGNNLALVDAQHGRFADAVRHLDEAGRGAAEVGPALVAMVLESRAWVTVQSGRLTDGLRLFDEAAGAFRTAGLPLGEHYVEYADALMDLRLLPEASAAARSAAEEFERSAVPLMGAEAQLRVAQLAMLAGDPAEAEAASTLAVESFARQRRGTWRARAQLVRAEARWRAGAATPAELREARRASRTLESLGTWSTAVQAYVVTGRIAAGLGRVGDAVDALGRGSRLAAGAPVLVRLRGHVAAALAGRLLDRDADVLAHCRRGLADLARYRGALPSVELRALASGHGAELGQLGLQVVVGGRSPARVFDWLERTRAAALLAVEPPNVADIEADLEELRAVQAELGGLGQQTNRCTDAPRVLQARQAAIEHRIRRATWHRGVHNGPERGTTGLARLRELLDGRLLVEYGLLGDRLVAVVVQPRRSRLVDLGPTAAVTEQNRSLFFALRRLTRYRPPLPLRDSASLRSSRSQSRPAIDALAAARLSADVRIARLRELLVRPLGLPDDAELVVVPVGPLHAVPWSALHDGPVSVAPSATFWARTREAALARRPGGAVVLVEGPNLVGAAAEVRRLRALYPDATVVSPPASTAQMVARLLDRAALAHLACHGLLRSDNPMFSSLVLSDGPLTVQELQTRGVAPHRLVLASCQSGADVSYAGDEVLGFVSALLARGTAGVVASTAAIPDVAAVDLMCALHEGVARGQTLARALHAARASLDREAPGAFVNWCTFSAHGAG